MSFSIKERSSLHVTNTASFQVFIRTCSAKHLQLLFDLQGKLWSVSSPGFVSFLWYWALVYHVMS